MKEEDELNQRINERLSRIKNRMLVFSGKGGVGKSTVSANLALGLSRAGSEVGLMDVDLHGPNLAKMLGVEDKKMEISSEGAKPIRVNEKLHLVSISFLLQDSNTPIIWRGPLKMKAIRQFVGDVQWGGLDWLIIDSPPGTGDEPLSIAQVIPATGAVVVTTPQEVSLMDSRKAVAFARKLNLTVLGIIENMSGFICPHCGKNTDLFKQGGGERAAREMGVPFLGRIPLDQRVVESGDSGNSFLLDNPDSEAGRGFKKIVDRIINLSVNKEQ